MCARPPSPTRLVELIESDPVDVWLQPWAPSAPLPAQPEPVTTDD